MQLKSLADFRRFLATPGATVQIIRHDWADEGKFSEKPGFRDPRQVAKLQSNAVKFSNDSWLDWRRGAKEFRFDGSDIVTVNLSDDGSFNKVFQYRCWIQ